MASLAPLVALAAGAASPTPGDLDVLGVAPVAWALVASRLLADVRRSPSRFPG